MPQADANLTSLAFWEESTYGTAATGGPDFKNIRFTSESFRQETATTQSSEIRTDRQVSDVIRTSISVSGDVGIELSYGQFDLWMEAGLLSGDWTGSATVDGADTAVSAVASDNSYNHTSAWAANPSIGDWIYVSGFTGNTANNGYSRVTAVTGTKITVDHKTLVDDAAGEAVTIKTLDYVRNGTELRPFNIEREYTDVSNEFVQFLGMAIDSWSLTMSADSIVTGSFSWLGKSETSATSTLGDGANSDAFTSTVMNSIDNVSGFFENGASFDITAFSLNVSNNLRTRQQVGTLGAISVGKGTSNVSGSLSCYFSAKALYDKYLNFTTTSLTLILEDSAGQAYVIFLPKVKLTSGARAAGGQNTDVIQEVSFEAFRDTTSGRPDMTLEINRWPGS